MQYDKQEVTKVVSLVKKMVLKLYQVYSHFKSCKNLASLPMNVANFPGTVLDFP